MARIIHLSEAWVRKTLPVDKSIQLAREAYIHLAKGEAVNPERTLLTTSYGTSVYCMPAYIAGRKTVAVKIARASPENPKRDLPTVTATVYVYDSSSGRELAHIEAEALTALRTAASTAVATDLLAKGNAENLGVFGTGRQAEAHIPAIARVRKLSRVIVYSRDKRRRRAFAIRMSRTHNLRVEAAETPPQVVENSDILVLATNSKVPLFKGELVRPGTHVNVIGAALPDAREIDTTLVKRSLLVVDSIGQAKSSYGEIIIPLQENAIKESDMQELGRLLAQGTFAGTKEQITVFKSGGLAVLDAITADYLMSHLPR